jgi:hypothetical protein
VLNQTYVEVKRCDLYQLNKNLQTELTKQLAKKQIALDIQIATASFDETLTLEQQKIRNKGVHYFNKERGKVEREVNKMRQTNDAIRWKVYRIRLVGVI